MSFASVWVALVFNLPTDPVTWSWIEDFILRQAAVVGGDGSAVSPEEMGFLYGRGFCPIDRRPGAYHSKRFAVLYAVSLEGEESLPMYRWGRLLVGGRWLIANIAEPPRRKPPPIETVLEMSVDRKYYLRKEQVARKIERTREIKGEGYLASALKPGPNLVRFRNDEGITVLKHGECPTLRYGGSQIGTFIIEHGRKAPVDAVEENNTNN